MIKIAKLVGDEMIKVGNFKSFVAFANWCDENPEENIGTYYTMPSRCASLASMQKVEYDGVFCTAERRGNI